MMLCAEKEWYWSYMGVLFFFSFLLGPLFHFSLRAANIPQRRQGDLSHSNLTINKLNPLKPYKLYMCANVASRIGNDITVRWIPKISKVIILLGTSALVVFTSFLMVYLRYGSRATTLWIVCVCVCMQLCVLNTGMVAQMERRKGRKGGVGHTTNSCSCCYDRRCC